MDVLSQHRRYHSKFIRKALTVAFSNDIPASFWTVYTPDLHHRGLVDFSPVAPEKRKSFQITKRGQFS